MNLSAETLVAVFVIVVITIGLLFAIRELLCWYWKINEIRNLLQKILERLPGETKVIADKKIVKPAASNEPVGMKRVDFENKKVEEKR